MVFPAFKYTEVIKEKVESGKLKIVPMGEMHFIFKRRVEDISFSRPSKDLSWGVPVPNDLTQTMYVWATLSNLSAGFGGSKLGSASG